MTPISEKMFIFFGKNANFKNEIINQKSVLDKKINSLMMKEKLIRRLTYRLQI
jgi:hypothetical protein